MLATKVALVVIDEHLREEVELRGQFSDISKVRESVVVRLVEGVEYAFRVVKCSSMQLNISL